MFDISGKKIGVKSCGSGFMHISLDDVETCIVDISTHQYNSIFDNQLFSFLRELHSKYNAVFSLYVQNLSRGFLSLSSRYMSEFLENSDWLKIGFHTYTTQNLENATYQEAQTQYNDFVTALLRFGGSTNVMDRMPRLGNYKASSVACSGLKDANAGIVGLLCTSYIRTSYYLTAEQSERLRSNGWLFDTEKGLAFLSTSMCFDWFLSSYTSESDYDHPAEDNVYDELVLRSSTPKYAKAYSGLEIFGHETYVYSNNKYKTHIEDACKFGYDYNYVFDFPQNRIANALCFMESIQ